MPGKAASGHDRNVFYTQTHTPLFEALNYLIRFLKWNPYFRN